MERLGTLALRAAAVCGDAVLSLSHQVARFSPNIPPGPEQCGSTSNHCIRGSQVMPTTFWNDACVLKLCPRSLICVVRSQFYVQRFQIPEGHLQRQVQPPCDHPLSGEAQGSKGSSIGGKKGGGIVPIRSGKRAAAGLNRIVLKVRNDGPKI